MLYVWCFSLLFRILCDGGVYKMNDTDYENLCAAKELPNAVAYVRGIGENQDLSGIVTFRQMPNGVLVTTDICGLPHNDKGDIFAMHIHQGSSCSGNETDPLADTLGHFNPTNAPHPLHAGDLPPLFADNGCAWLAVRTGRFSVTDVIGKTLVIHSGTDDFTSQPAGNAGTKIACGEIRKT